MDLFTLIGVVLRRWRIVVPMLLVTFGLAYVVQTTTPPEYQANGYLVLQAPAATAAAANSPAIDLRAVAEGIELDGDERGRNFTVSPLGGLNYSIAAAAPTAGQAEDDAVAVVAQMGERIIQIQEQQGIPVADRIELRQIDPQVVAEMQADESFLATVDVFLNDPANALENPYLPNSATGRILQVAMMGDSGQSAFQDLTGDVALVVSQEARDAAPLLSLQTTGSDPQEVIDGFYNARDLMVQDLVQRQEAAGVIKRGRITLGVVDAPMGVTDESPPVERATAAIIALGGMLALGLAIALEGLSRRPNALSSILSRIEPDERDQADDGVAADIAHPQHERPPATDPGVTGQDGRGAAGASAAASDTGHSSPASGLEGRFRAAEQSHSSAMVGSDTERAPRVGPARSGVPRVDPAETSTADTQGGATNWRSPGQNGDRRRSGGRE